LTGSFFSNPVNKQTDIGENFSLAEGINPSLFRYCIRTFDFVCTWYYSCLIVCPQQVLSFSLLFWLPSCAFGFLTYLLITIIISLNTKLPMCMLYSVWWIFSN